MKDLSIAFAITLTLLATLATPLIIMDKEYQQHAFLHEGQYAPKYVAYDDYQMLHECEQHSLSYDYEQAICIEY